MGICRFHSFTARFYFEFISLVCAGFRIAQSICAPSNRNFFLCPQESYHHLLIFGEKAALYFLFLSLLYLISLFFNINIFVLVAFFEFLINFCSIFYVLKSCFFFYFIVIRDHLYHLEYSYFKQNLNAYSNYFDNTKMSFYDLISILIIHTAQVYFLNLNQLIKHFLDFIHFRLELSGWYVIVKLDFHPEMRS